MYRRPLLLVLLLAGVAAGQDERRVSSPNGRLEFRIGIAQPETSGLSRLAYQIFESGHMLVDTSYLGIDVLNQEPLLGQNLGLTTARSAKAKGYNSMFVEYMQNGSIGRRLAVEVRVADDGVAFRYVIPRSTPLEEILIADEATEFALGPDIVRRGSLPFIAARPGGGWLAIAESESGRYPKASLERGPAGVAITHIAARFEGKTPWTSPWRIVIVGPARERLMSSEIVQSLQR